MEGPTTEALRAGLHPLGRSVEGVNDARSAPQYRRSLARDIPIKPNAWREVFVIGLNHSIEAGLALLNQSAHRIETTQQTVRFFERRYIGPADAQIEHEFRGDAPVILEERRGRRPVQLAKRWAHELIGSARFSGEEVFQWRGTRESLFATELDSATRVMAVEIGVDVSKLAAELESVLTPQIREVVRKIENRVAELSGTATPTAQRTTNTITGNVDAGKASRTRDAGVEGVVLAIGEEVRVVGNQTKVNVGEAKVKIVQHAGTGGPNPV